MLRESERLRYNLKRMELLLLLQKSLCDKEIQDGNKSSLLRILETEQVVEVDGIELMIKVEKGGTNYIVKVIKRCSGFQSCIHLCARLKKFKQTTVQKLSIAGLNLYFCPEENLSILFCKNKGLTNFYFHLISYLLRNCNLISNSNLACAKYLCHSPRLIRSSSIICNQDVQDAQD